MGLIAENIRVFIVYCSTRMGRKSSLFIDLPLSQLRVSRN